MAISSATRTGKTILMASEFSKPFWLEAQKLPPEAQSRYHLYGIYQYSPDLDLNRLMQALQVTVNTNYHLRSNFFQVGEALKQAIQDYREANLTIYHANTEKASQEIIDRAIHQPFYLETDPLHRFVLIDNKYNQTHILLLNFHHIIIDETQFDSLVQQIEDHYYQPKSLTLTDQPEVKQLAEYLMWEKEQIQKIDTEKMASRFKGYPVDIELPYRMRMMDYAGKKVIANNYVLNSDLYQKLKTWSAKADFSLFDLLKTAWATLIGKYSNQDKIMISDSFDVRKQRFEHIKGCYLNTRIHPMDLNLSLQEIIEADRATRGDILHEATQFFPIHLKANGLQRSLLGEVFFARVPLGFTTLKLAQDNVGERHKQMGHAALLFKYDDRNGELRYQILSLEHLFEEDWLECIPLHFEILLLNLIDQPTEKLKRLNILTPTEYHRIIYDYNQTDKDYPRDKTIHALFEEQVER
ncbi:MAG: hypothetical protein A2103_02695, partial [Gammaproteobacteria bacterium GWF2_41_13]